MLGSGNDKRTFFEPHPTPDPNPNTNPSPRTDTPHPLSASSCLIHAPLLSASSPAWPPFLEGMSLPPPCLTESRYPYGPYHHSEKECEYCVSDMNMRRKKRGREEEGWENAGVVVKRIQLDEEGYKGEEMMRDGNRIRIEDVNMDWGGDVDMDMDLDMSDTMVKTQTRGNKLMKFGRKRKMDTPNENESPTKKVRFANAKAMPRVRFNGKKEVEGVEVDEDEEVVLKECNMNVGRNAWEQVRWWSNERWNGAFSEL